MMTAGAAHAQNRKVGGRRPAATSAVSTSSSATCSAGSSEVSGFFLLKGRLAPIPHSVRFLSTNTSGAASLSFSPDGQFLAVSEKLTNKIDIFNVQGDGTLSKAVVNASADPGVFAVAFAPNGALLVAETGPAGVPNASTVASYSVLAGGILSPISTAVPTLGNANCWNAITADGRFVYNSNAGSANIAGFATNHGRSPMNPVPLRAGTAFSRTSTIARLPRSRCAKAIFGTASSHRRQRARRTSSA